MTGSDGSGKQTGKHLRRHCAVAKGGSRLRGREEFAASLHLFCSF